MKSEINKIHNINSAFNLFFGPFIYVFAAIVVLLMAILPYHGRLLLALTINICFNRPVVYLNMIAKKISYPIQKLNVLLVYGIIFGLFAPIYRIFFKSKNVGFVKVDDNYNTDLTSSHFQS